MIGLVPGTSDDGCAETRALISGLACPNSIPEKIVTAWELHALRLPTSHYQLVDITRVLTYQEIRSLLGWNDGRIEPFLRQRILRAEVAQIEGHTAAVPNDRSDAPIFVTVIASSADVLVTGDGDRLVLRERCPIETPAQFALRLRLPQHHCLARPQGGGPAFLVP